MEHIHVDGFELKPLERLFTGPDDVLGGEIVPLRRIGVWGARAPHATLCEDQHPLAHPGNFLEGLTQHSLGLAAAVDVRVVEECETSVVCRQDRAPTGRAG